jgi:enoyl-CoA hydratase
MELQMTAQLITAEDALQLGLVNYITDAENLLPKTKEILAMINTKAPIAISKIIDCVNTAATGDKNGFEEEVAAFGECFDTNDMKEGTTAFLEKRKANFTGK